MDAGEEHEGEISMKILLQKWTMPERLPMLLGILGILCVIVAVIYFWRRKKKKTESEYHALHRMREEALERALANPLRREDGAQAEMQRRPFHVEYSKGEENHKKNDVDTMLQLTESTELSQRKYMFRCKELISIGNQFGTVAILSDSSDARQIHCQIFFYEGENYVRSVGRRDIFLKRRGRRVMVNDLGIKLLSKDSFTVDGTSFQVDFL